MLKKIDTYILKKIFSTFIFVVGVLEIIICVIDYTEKNDDFIRGDVAVIEIIKYYLVFIPFIASLLTPITMFIATVIVTSQLASRTEIIAMLGSSIDFRRIIRPYFIAGSIVALCTFYLNGYMVPYANKQRSAFENEYVRTKPKNHTERNIHLKIAPNSYLYMYSYNNSTEVGSNITIEHVEGNTMKQKIKAHRIEWDSGRWLLKKWQIRTITDSSEYITSGEVLDTLLNLTPSDFDFKYRFHETMTIAELNDYIDLQLSRGGDDVPSYQIEKYIRYMQPFSVIILTLMGLFMSSRKSRQGTGLQIAFGFLLAFAFIIAFVFARAIAAVGSVNPLLAVWIPNIVFSGLLIYMYKKTPK